MASIKKYAAKTAKNGYLWRVQYRDAKGTSRTKSGFSNKSQAETWAAQNTVNLAVGDWIAPEDQRTTVGELWDRWWRSKEPQLAESSQKALKASWTTHVKPRWGQVRLVQVDEVSVQDWVDELSEVRSPTIVHRAVEVLRGLMGDAVRFKLIRHNPVTGIRLPPKRGQKPTTITQAQLHALVDASTRHKSLLLFLGYTGARWSEAAHLTVGDVDVAARHAYIAKTKTKRPRTIGVPQVALDAMKPDLKGKLPGALVWTNMDGSPVSTPSRRSWFHSALDRARAEDDSFPEITPHDLRHACASILISRGASVAIVQRQLGHTSAKRTLDTYTHLFQDDLDSLISGVTGVLDSADSSVVKLS